MRDSVRGGLCRTALLFFLFERHDCDSRCHLLPSFHSPDSDQTVGGDQQATIVQRWIRGFVVDDLPFAGAQVPGEGHRRRLGGVAVGAKPLVVVQFLSATGKIYFLIVLGPARCYAIAGLAGMSGDLRPLDLGGVVMVDLSPPALPGKQVLRVVGGRALERAVSVDNGVANY